MIDYRQAAQALANALPDIGKEWHDGMLHAIATGARGTARAWFEARQGRDDVYTLQANVFDPVDVRGMWTPGARTVTEVRPSGVKLDDSTREFRGLSVIGMTDRVLVTATKWGDAVQIIVFSTPRDN